VSSGLQLSYSCVSRQEGPDVSTYHVSFGSLKDVPEPLVPYLSSEARQRRNPFEKSKDGAVDVFLVCDNDNPGCGMLLGTLNALGVDGDTTKKYNGDDYDFTVSLQASAGKMHKGRYYSVLFLSDAYTKPVTSAARGAETITPGFIAIPQAGGKSEAMPRGSQNFRIHSLIGIFAEEEVGRMDVEIGGGLEQVDGKSGRGVNAGGVQQVFHEVTNSIADFQRPDVNSVSDGYGRRTSMFLSLKASVKKRLENVFQRRSRKPKAISARSPLQGRASIKLHYTGPAVGGGKAIKDASHVQSVLGLDYDWLARSSKRASYRLSGELDGRLYENGARELDLNVSLQRARKESVWTLGVSQPLVNDQTFKEYDVQKEGIYRLGYTRRLFSPPQGR